MTYDIYIYIYIHIYIYIYIYIYCTYTYTYTYSYGIYVYTVNRTLQTQFHLAFSQLAPKNWAGKLLGSSTEQPITLGQKQWFPVNVPSTNSLINKDPHSRTQLWKPGRHSCHTLLGPNFFRGPLLNQHITYS